MGSEFKEEEILNNNNKLKDFGNKVYKYMITYKLVVLSIVMLWLKSYIVAKFVFDIDIENKAQEVILFISPLSFSILIYGICLVLCFKESRDRVVLGVSIVTSIILYANVLFYRFYTDFITIPLLFQTSNMNDLQSSVGGLIQFSDIFYIVDVLIIFILIKFLKLSSKSLNRSSGLVLILTGLIVFGINLSMSEAERPELLTRTFDREILVKNLGLFNYHVYDIYIQSKSSAQKALAEEKDVSEVKDYMLSKGKNVNEDLTGIAEGKNVVYIALESLQSFVINEYLDGEEITPFLNSLIEDSFYFSNFYHQTAQGKTSDSEFLLDTGFYPLGRGSVYFTHASNTYKGLPLILGSNGYSTNVFHANNKSFWNRDVMYVSMGLENYFDIDSYDVREDNSVGWGLKDKDFFSQSIDIMKELEEPFYSKLITLTNHFPFELDESDMDIKPWNSNSRTLNRYFTTVNYLDRAVEGFFEEIKSSGMYEDSIFVLYGDHYGISENHNKAMAKFLNKGKLTAYDVAELQKVPLYIHIPGVTDNGNGGELSVYGGQIDLKPTVLNLLGIDVEDVYFGNDLLSDSHSNEVSLRDGRVMNDEFVYAGDVCYVRPEKSSDYLSDEELLDLEDKFIKNKLNYEEAYKNYLDDLGLDDYEDIDIDIDIDSDLEVGAGAGAEVEVEVGDSADNDLEDDFTESNILSFEEYKKEYKEKLVTGYPVDKIYCEGLIDFSNRDLQLNDKIIYGDLMRFYNYLGDIDFENIDNEKVIEDFMKKSRLK